MWARMVACLCQPCERQAICSGRSLLLVTLNWISKRRRMDGLIKTLNGSCTVMLKLKKYNSDPISSSRKCDFKKKISLYFLSAAFIYYRHVWMALFFCRMMQLAVVRVWFKEKHFLSLIHSLGIALFSCSEAMFIPVYPRCVWSMTQQLHFSIVTGRQALLPASQPPHAYHQVSTCPSPSFLSPSSFFILRS